MIGFEWFRYGLMNHSVIYLDSGSSMGIGYPAIQCRLIIPKNKPCFSGRGGLLRLSWWFEPVMKQILPCWTLPQFAPRVSQLKTMMVLRNTCVVCGSLDPLPARLEVPLRIVRTWKGHPKRKFHLPHVKDVMSLIHKISLYIQLMIFYPTLSPTWKWTLNERKLILLILEGAMFHWTMIMGGRVFPIRM